LYKNKKCAIFSCQVTFLVSEDAIDRADSDMGFRNKANMIQRFHSGTPSGPILLMDKKHSKLLDAHISPQSHNQQTFTLEERKKGRHYFRALLQSIALFYILMRIGSKTEV